VNKFSLTYLLKEENATGTGASFSPGSGEQYGSAKAFGKKKLLVRKKLKEDVSFSPEKREEFYKKCESEYSKSKQEVERYINIFNGFNMGEMMENIDKAKNFVKVGETIEKKFESISKRLWDDADAWDEEGNHDEYSKTISLEDKYSKLQNSVYKIYDSMEDIIRLFEKLKDDE